MVDGASSLSNMLVVYVDSLYDMVAGAGGLKIRLIWLAMG